MAGRNLGQAVAEIPYDESDSLCIGALAMLVRREGETLAELLTRLDLAIAKARTEDIFTDEINPPHS